MFRLQMTDVSGNTASQYAVVAPISVATDISPSRQTRESSNEFLQEHTIISELKKKDRAAGRLKYVDVEFNNVSTEQHAQVTRKEVPTAGKSVVYEDWTVPRPRPRKQPPPPPTTKPKPAKAKSLAQMVVPVDTATISGETVKTKARCASESDTIDDERVHQQQPQVPSQSVNSLRRPSRKAPPPPKQQHQMQTNDKESVAQTSQKAKSPKPLRGNIGDDKETVDSAPLSPKHRRAVSSEKEIVEITPLAQEHHQVKRTSSFKEAKSLRPVRKAPPPPNKSTEYINVSKDEDDVTFSTFFVSHKKAQSMSYENVVCDNNDASLMGTFPRSQAYENVDRGRKVHRSDEGQHKNYSRSYENVASTRQAIEDKLNKSRPNNIDMNKVDADGGDTVQNQQEASRSNGGINYQKQGGKKKSVRKKRNISPPRTPPPPPPEAAGRLPLSPPEATSEFTSAGSPPTYSKLKRPVAPPPPPPGATRQLGTPPPRPPPPDEAQPPNIPPPPNEMQPPDFVPPPPPVEMQPPSFTPAPPPVTMQPPSFTPAPPPVELQPPNFTPPPPPVEMQLPKFTPPPPPDETHLVNGVTPPRPPPPTHETKPVPLTRHSISKKQPKMTPPPLEKTILNSKSSNSTHSRVALSEGKAEKQVPPTASAVLKSTPLSPPLVMAKKPLTSPPSTLPPPPPPPPPAAPETPDDQKRVSFEIPSSDGESGEVDTPSISTSSSEECFHQQQVIRQQQQNGDIDIDDLHADIITNYTTPPDFFGQPSRELDPITEYADTESSGSVYITRTVSDDALNWNSDQQLSADNSPDLRRLGGESTSEGSSSMKLAKSPLVEMNKTTTENGRSVSHEANHNKTSNIVEQQSPPRERKESGASPFWYRESMIMAVGRGNALHGYPKKKRPLPPPRSSQPMDPPLIENMESSPSRVRRPPENSAGTQGIDQNAEDVEISLAYTNSTSSSSSSAPCPIPPPRVNKETKSLPPTAPPRDRSSLSCSPARSLEKSKAAFTRVRAASFLTVSAGKELNTVTAMYMGSKQVDQYVGQINNIARDLSEKAASPMILYIATEKIRLAAPDSNVLFASFAVENILATTLCSINKRIVGMLVWKSRTLPSWHLIRCNDNLVAGSVLESIQMACETVKSDEITEVSHDICGSEVYYCLD